MKKILILLFLLLWLKIGYCADTKISDLTADTTPTSDDLVVTVNDPAGSPANKKVTLSNLGKGIENIDGEQITADTIDDDSIDFSDVTGADLTLTDCGAITTTGANDITAGGDAIVTGSDLTVGVAGIKLTSDGDGAITLLGLGNGYDEDLTLNFDDTENKIVASSSTGMATIDFGSIVLDANLTGNVTGNADTVTTNANLDGDVTSSGNTTTIADNVTVTGWTMGASVATTPAANDADTSLATTAFCETTQDYLKTSELVGANEAYDATNWDSDTSVPEKDDIRDKIEAMPQTAGDHITLTGTDLDIDDDFLLNSTSDTMAGTLTADGLTLGADENITLGTKTIDFNSTSSDFHFGDDISILDDNPALYIINTDNNKGYSLHLHDVSGDWPGLALFPGVWSGGKLNVGGTNNGYPVWYIDESFNFHIPKKLIHEEEKSAGIENLTDSDDDRPLGSFVRSVIITKVGAHCIGTCTTKATITLEDGSGNAMTHATCTAVASGTDITFVPVTAANTLNAGELLRFDVTNTPDPETDFYEITIGYKEN